jgi:hypothetical protein
MSLKQIQFQVNRSQIDLEADPESPRLQHESCSSHQELSIDITQILSILLSVFKLLCRVDRSSNSLELLYRKFFHTINFLC